MFEKCKNRIELIRRILIGAGRSRKHSRNAVRHHLRENGAAKMGIQNFSEDVLFVDLPSKEPQIGKELKNLNEVIVTRSDCDVVIDFFRVELITSSSISNLMILRNLLQERGRQLILCNVAVMTKYIFTVAGLDKVFDFVDDRFSALATMECADLSGDLSGDMSGDMSGIDLVKTETSANSD
jgi:anti-anti-sigma regulatory factor